MLAKLIEFRSVTERDALYVFDCPELARAASPGQIVELKITTVWTLSRVGRSAF